MKMKEVLLWFCKNSYKIIGVIFILYLVFIVFFLKLINDVTIKKIISYGFMYILGLYSGFLLTHKILNYVNKYNPNIEDSWFIQNKNKWKPSTKHSKRKPNNFV